MNISGQLKRLDDRTGAAFMRRVQGRYDAAPPSWVHPFGWLLDPLVFVFVTIVSTERGPMTGVASGAVLLAAFIGSLGSGSSGTGSGEWPEQ